jgi:hypothetical protein
MRKFLVIWLGQLLSLMGSAMTRFVLAIWWGIGRPVCWPGWRGPGAGMGLLLACGMVCALASLWGYLMPTVREVETILPDFDEVNTAVIP